MKSDLKFTTRTSSFLGRNGRFKSIGINVATVDKQVSLLPITSRDETGRAELLIPFEDVPALIERLRLITQNQKEK